MDSRNEPGARAAALAGVLDGLKERLDAIEALSSDVRGAIVRADRAAIESATARLETLAQEFKLLAEEHARLTSADAGASDDPRVVAARDRLRSAAQRLARSSAVAGGLLARVIQMSRGLLSVVTNARGGTYLSTGRTPELAVGGIRLREQA